MNKDTIHMEIQKPEIFISYAWGIEREDIVNSLYDIFLQKGYNIIRDKINIGYKGSITDFMNKIGKGKYVIIVISDKYLKSENCMHEIVQIQKHGGFYDRIFPIVLGDANFYKPIKRLQYIKYWEDEIINLNKGMKGVNDMSVIADVQKELQNYREILNSISNIYSPSKI
ncbi:MAG: toll/interleukin-1 receptor domain-containing protein [Saprospirales bacterium]|nr:toll/interleukin-1 receptor domain-containing protein [Saprospirales bacterium]